MNTVYLRELEQLLDLVESRAMRVTPGPIKFSDRFLEDLGIDSLGFVDLIFEIEERLGIQIPGEAIVAEELGTVGELLAIVRSQTMSDR